MVLLGCTVQLWQLWQLRSLGSSRIAVKPFAQSRHQNFGLNTPSLQLFWYPCLVLSTTQLITGRRRCWRCGAYNAYKQQHGMLMYDYHLNVVASQEPVSHCTWWLGSLYCRHFSGRILLGFLRWRHGIIFQISNGYVRIRALQNFDIQWDFVARYVPTYTHVCLVILVSVYVNS